VVDLCTLHETDTATSVSQLRIRPYLVEYLQEAEIHTLGQLQEHLQSDTLKDVPRFGRLRALEVREAFNEYCIKTKGNFISWIIRTAEIWQYLLIAIGMAVLLYISVDRNGGSFDQDERWILVAVIASMLVFDIGRWARDVGSQLSTLSESHLRALIAYAVATVTLAACTRESWKSQEYIRVIGFGVVLGSVELARTLMRRRYIETKPIEDDLEPIRLIDYGFPSRCKSWFDGLPPAAQAPIVIFLLGNLFGGLGFVVQTMSWLGVQVESEGLIL
jgi:hypothetical protein